MKLISKGKKDYYDYLTGSYGIDEDVVYDRSESYVFRNGTYWDPEWFDTSKRIDDIHLRPVKKYRQKKGAFGRGEFVTVMEGRVSELVLEVGYNRYRFEINRYLDDNDNVKLDVRLLETAITKKKFIDDVPVIITGIGNLTTYRQLANMELNHLRYNIYKNPIMMYTWIPKFIPADEMYNLIYNYLISIKDKKIEDNRTDVQKLESKGFDKKTSFRNM